MFLDMIQERENLADVEEIEGNYSSKILEQERGVGSRPKWRIYL